MPHEGGRGRGVPTLDSVAEAAGVSRATASRVLSGSPRVSDRARRLVLQAASGLDYVPNGPARTLVTRRSGAVAFVVCEPEEKFFADPFFSTVLQGAHRVVAESGRQLLFAVVADEGDRERLVRFAAGGHLDAALVLSAHAGESAPARLTAQGLPVVLGGRPPATGAHVPYLDCDNVGGGRTAAEHLRGRGRRHLATITGPADMVVSADRLAGWRQVVGTGGAVAVGDFTAAGGRRAMAELLERSPRPDGVFAANDLMAVGAAGVLRERGLRVPEDVAVVGFDDVPLAAAVGLTTVRQPLEELGRCMAAAVVTGLETGEEVEAPASPLATTLVVRASS